MLYWHVNRCGCVQLAMVSKELSRTQRQLMRGTLSDAEKAIVEARAVELEEAAVGLRRQVRVMPPAGGPSEAGQRAGGAAAEGIEGKGEGPRERSASMRRSSPVPSSRQAQRMGSGEEEGTGGDAVEEVRCGAGHVG